MVNKGERCYGCSACASVCPTSAITMTADKNGFKYPKIDADICSKCGLCDKICPVDFKRENNFNLKAFAVQHKDKEILLNSSSGGAFTSLSDRILSENGVIYGSAFDEYFNVVHVRAEDKDSRDRCRGSKYVQSNLDGVFKKVKEDLIAGRKVLFTGTPCQVAGLKNYLMKDYDNLLLSDLVCNGVPSPIVWSEHVKMLEKKNGEKLSAYKFRPKDWGWHVHNELSVYESGKKFHSNVYSRLFSTVYYSRLAHRPSCSTCQYSNLFREGDITIADCRGIDKVTSDFEAFDGVSLVLVNSEKGMAFFEKVKEDFIVREIDVQKVLQPPLKNPGKANENSKLFWDTFHKKGYIKAVKAVFGKLYFIKAKIKKILGRN